MAAGRRWLSGIATLGTLLGAAVAGAAVGASPAAADSYTSVAVDPTFQVDLRGSGHGHGLSQYGAEGAALQGLGFRRILHFYYPHTRLRAEDPFSIRVLLSGAGDATTVAAQRGLHVTGVDGTLPIQGVTRYRLTAGRRTGITLSALHRSRWKTVQRGLTNGAAFWRRGAVRVFLADGTSTAYRQRVVAVRRGAHGSSGVMTINAVSMDNYVAGVVPREMPPSWEPAAVRAQAVAARSYARYEAAHSSNSAYDICDSANCQVYGGARHYGADGSLLWTEDRDALAGNQNLYLTYHGAAICAQFSASDGGWTVDGGLPYLVAQADPYDDSASGDPYAGYRQTVRSSDLAAYFGLDRVTGIAILSRDGNGAWGGRVVAARVSGTDSQGQRASVRTDGFNLQWAMGVGTNWLRIDPNHPPRGGLHTVRAENSSLRVAGWAVDTDHAGHSPSLRVVVDGKIIDRFRTRVPRPRIVHKFALSYRRPGFRRSYRLASGRHRACVVVADSDGLHPVRLGCARLRIRRH